MIWGMNIKKIFLLCVSVFLFVPVFADTDYSRYRGNTSIQNDFSEYMDTLQKTIQKNWTPPDTMENGHVTVMFKVNRFGQIVNQEILSGSGNEVYDESAIDALNKSAPFPRFPANSTRDILTIKYNFDTSLVKTDEINEYVKKSDKFFNIDNKVALDYINLAINAVQGDIGSYFLYGKRSKIKHALGDIQGAQEDFEESKRLKTKFDRKRIMHCKLAAETEGSAFAYFYLANAYDIAGDYMHAIEAIDKAISLTDLNNHYKRYRAELVLKQTKL